MATRRGRRDVPLARPANDNDPEAQLAPWPLVDRYPVVLGATLTLAHVSNAMRSSTYGYRTAWVDILNELVEREPHGQAVLGQRILAVAGGRLEIEPAKTEAGTLEHATAADLAQRVRAQVEGIENFKRAVAWLLWAIYYGVAATEIHWERRSGEWRPRRLSFIHSRRLAYPDPQTWDLHVWDQGPVSGWTAPAPTQPTSNILGLRVADYAGKFIVHTPTIRADYPTREGLGRILGFWFALKALAVRGGAQSVERFAKPWALSYFSTQRDGKPRTATEDDIKKADAAVRALGIGSLSSATLPDSVKVVLERVEGGISHREFVELCNQEIGKCVLGQNLTTEVGQAGSRAAAEVLKEGSREINRFDADCLADDIERDLIRSIVRLNWPELEHLTPRLIAHPAERPDPDALINRAVKGASVGMPIDADEMATRAGLPVIAPDNTTARRLLPVKAVEPIALLQPNLSPPTPASADETAP